MILSDNALNSQTKQNALYDKIHTEEQKKRITRRLWMNRFASKGFSLSMILALSVLVILIYQIISKSIGWINVGFLTRNLSIFQIGRAHV